MKNSISISLDGKNDIGNVTVTVTAAWFLTAGIFRTPGRERLWTDLLIPVAVRTVIAAVPVYLLFLPLSRLLTKHVRSMDAAAIRRDW